VFDVNPFRRLAMKMLKNVVFTSVLLVPMLLSAQQSNTRYGNHTTIQMESLLHNTVIKALMSVETILRF